VTAVHAAATATTTTRLHPHAGRRAPPEPHAPPAARRAEQDRDSELADDLGVITTANKDSKTCRSSLAAAAEANTNTCIWYEGTCEGSWGGIGLGSSRATNFLDNTSASNGTYSCQKVHDLVTRWGSRAPPA
jgi:hypothetical protein